jgi:signal transduction histidine kinase
MALEPVVPELPANVSAEEPPTAAAGRGWRAPLPALALAFVGVSLLVLAITPLRVLNRIEALRSVSAKTYDIAVELGLRLRGSLQDEIIYHQEWRLNASQTALSRYRVARAQEDSILTALADVAPRIGGATPAVLDSLSQVTGRWHKAPDALIAGRMSAAAFEKGIPLLTARRDTMISAIDHLLAEVDRHESANRARGAAAARQQRDISKYLGFVGVAALLMVIFVGMRERRLTRQLSRALKELRARMAAEALAREEEARARQAAETAVRMRDQVLRIVSHDLKNPLHTMRMATQLVQDETLQAPARHKQLGVIERSIARMQRLVLDLLDVGRLESGHSIAVSLTPVAVRELLTETEDAFEAQATEKMLTLTVQSDVDGACVLADRGRMLQVLANLVGNAVKFTPAGGRIEMRAEPDGSGTRVVVANSGPGIPRSALGKLFQPFWQAPETASQGTGLGLTITKGIVEAHRSALTVTSEPGALTEFAFTLPSA